MIGIILPTVLSFHLHGGIYERAESSQRIQPTDKMRQNRLQPHKESHSSGLIALARWPNANSATAAQPVPLLPATTVVTQGVRREEGPLYLQSRCLVWALKWQCDQLCVESQPFFVPSAKESGAWGRLTGPTGLKNLHIHIWSLDAGCRNVESAVSKRQTLWGRRRIGDVPRQQVKPAIYLAA